MSLVELTKWLQQSPIAIAIQDSAFAYPLIEATHVLSLTLSVGTILWFDLRLVGLILRGEPIKAMYASLKPWIFAGFILMLISGVLLFINRAADVWINDLFRVKLVLLILCGINIGIYHFVVERDNSDWDCSDIPPLSARIVGGLSLVLWFSVIAVGRFMAYSL